MGAVTAAGRGSLMPASMRSSIKGKNGFEAMRDRKSTFTSSAPRSPRGASVPS